MSFALSIPQSGDHIDNVIEYADCFSTAFNPAFWAMAKTLVNVLCLTSGL